VGLSVAREIEEGHCCRALGTTENYCMLRKACGERQPRLVFGPPAGPLRFAGQREHAMARVTVEDCLEREENRFALVILAARRTRQLMKGAAPLVHSKNKAAVTALREIAAGKVHFDRPSNDAVSDWIEHM